MWVSEEIMSVKVTCESPGKRWLFLFYPLSEWNIHLLKLFQVLKLW